MASPGIAADPHDGPYVLQPWVDSVPLSADGSQDGIKINCVEYYGSCAMSSVLILNCRGNLCVVPYC
jgi:hypothetical protein